MCSLQDTPEAPHETSPILDLFQEFELSSALSDELVYDWLDLLQSISLLLQQPLSKSFEDFVLRILSVSLSVLLSNPEQKL